jgi:hypothetical protein
MATYCAANLLCCVLPCSSSTNVGMPRRAVRGALHIDLLVTVAWRW